jgi:uncharacterized protein YnzC (UPF0291/DUF896 family)
MNAKLELGLFIFAGIVFLIGAVWVVTTEKRLKRFFLGKKAKDLEDTIVLLENEMAKLKKAQEISEKEISVIQAKLRKSIRGLETIRFNPFPDQGSNQSFAIGMLDEDGDGVVISSLYYRERMSIFAKPVKKHKSTYELTDEEKDALAKALVK